MFSIIKNYISDNTGILIRLDDIAENMNWELMEKIEILFDKYNIKPVLGVIPYNKDSELLAYPKKNDFWDKVKEWDKKGWKIAMHGLNHLYDIDTNKKDYFKYGGKSEFYGHPLDIQTDKIRNGLKKFEQENIKISCFFAPNHTYDNNTFLALKKSGISEVIDGYGLMPFSKNNIKFIPQLFYKNLMLPFGIQSTQIHLNYWSKNDYDKFESFIIKNSKKVINYNQAITKVNNSILYSLINYVTKIILKIIRIIK